MPTYLFLPVALVRFWYIEAPVGLLTYFSSLNKAFLRLFSLPLFIRTFFKPLKNEYREGLVGFSKVMGILVKSVLILIDLALFALLLAFEVGFLLYFLLLPFISVYILFL